MIGKVINKYRIDEKLGEGGMGLVYKAWDTVLERAVALKMINPALSQNEIFFKCFLAEAKTLAKLDHPHIVNVYDLIEHEHGWFIVMQYIEGQTLAQKLAHEGALPVPQAMALGKQILSALGYAHQAGIVHRDMKPSNIILTREQQVKVTDFGLAKYQRGTVLTNTSATGGTPHYMSPEQVKNLAHVDHRSDIYAVGMTLYEMLAGKTPFPENAPPVDILNAILKNKFPPPSAQVATLPHTLDRLVLKAIAKAPEDRFQSAEAMAQVIDAFTRGEPTALRTSASTRRRRMLLMAALVLFSALSCVLLIPSLRERIVGWFASPNKVPIAVHTQPAGATVFWGKERLGITPIARCVVNEGWTDLRFEREGYLTKDTTLFLADKILGMQPQPLPLIMLQPAAHVALAIQPEEAGVTIDQKPVDKSQWGKPALAAGAHTIFIVSEGHAPLLAQFTLVQGRNPSLVYRLTRTIVEPALGELTLTSDPSGAKIELKGAKNFQTKSPLKNFKLPSGPYRLNLTKEKYQTYHETVHIDSGQVTTLPRSNYSLCPDA